MLIIIGISTIIITKESVIGIGSPILYYIRDPGVPIFTKGSPGDGGPHNNMNIGMGSPILYYIRERVPQKGVPNSGTNRRCRKNISDAISELNDAIPVRRNIV